MNKQNISKIEENIKKLNKSMKSISTIIHNQIENLENEEESSHKYSTKYQIMELKKYVENITKTKNAIFEMYVRLNTIITSEDEAEDEAVDESETQFDIQISL